MDEPLSWEAPEFEYQDRGLFWHYIVIATALLLVLISLWQKNLLFAVFVVLATATLFLWSKRKPPVYRITITRTRLMIGAVAHYELDTFSGFAIAKGRQDNPEWGRVFLQHKQRLRPYLAILVPRGKLEQVKTVLRAQLAELEHDTSLTDELIHFLKL